MIMIMIMIMIIVIFCIKFYIYDLFTSADLQESYIKHIEQMESGFNEGRAVFHYY